MFDTKWRISADMDRLVRATKAGVRMRLLPDVVWRRRIHGCNTSLTLKEQASDRLRVLRASLGRRRAVGKKLLP